MLSFLLYQDQHVLGWVNLRYCLSCQQGRGKQVPRGMRVVLQEREPSSICASKRKRMGCEQGGHFCRLRGFQEIKQFQGYKPQHPHCCNRVHSFPAPALNCSRASSSLELWFFVVKSWAWFLAFLLHSSLRL